MLRPWFAGMNSALDEFDRLSRNIEQLFDISQPINNIRGNVRGAFPSVNVHETPESVVVSIFVPGVEASQLDVTIEKNLLTVAAERDTGREIGENIDPRSYHRRERFTGSFRRVISLPDSIDPDKVEAQYADGILTVSIGKKDEEKARRIEISVG